MKPTIKSVSESVATLSAAILDIQEQITALKDFTIEKLVEQESRIDALEDEVAEEICEREATDDVLETHAIAIDTIEDFLKEKHPHTFVITDNDKDYRRKQYEKLREQGFTHDSITQWIISGDMKDLAKGSVKVTYEEANLVTDSLLELAQAGALFRLAWGK